MSLQRREKGYKHDIKSPERKQKQLKMTKEQLINDLDIVIEALTNNDIDDATKLIIDIQEDIKINSLLGQ